MMGSGGDTVTPPAAASTTNALTPRLPDSSPVRANTTRKSASAALVMKCFVPVIR